MQYEEVKEAVFLKRPNRFTADVVLEGRTERVHVKNTGRCRELLTEGARVFLEKAKNPERKTKYSLIAVYKGDTLINMDSQAPNRAAEEALGNGVLRELGTPEYIKREKTFGNSRFDLYYERGEKKGFLEVKGVTLEEDGTALFPDAPTERGTKHLKELIRAKQEGFEASVLFVVQMKGVRSFRPNKERDSTFAEALGEAEKNGVNILVYDCLVRPDTLLIENRIPYEL